MSETDLSAFREEIDAIDADLHALLMRRAQISEKVRAIKTGDELKLRPGREANILRALVARHSGAFPKPQLVRIWREILSASLAMQGPFSVGVYATETAHSLWDLTRDHFGGGVQSWKFGTIRRVVETVVTGQCTIGIVPEPDSEDSDPWWQYLLVHPNAANRGRPARIVAKLPFARPAGAYGGAEAVVIARADAEESGEDRTFLAVAHTGDFSSDLLLGALAECGFANALLRAKWLDAATQKRWVHLVEVDGCVAQGDARIARAPDVIGKTFNEIIVIGGFAVPLILDDASASAAYRARMS